VIAGLDVIAAVTIGFDTIIAVLLIVLLVFAIVAVARRSRL
jgi:hypothetical protein